MPLSQAQTKVRKISGVIEQGVTLNDCQTLNFRSIRAIRTRSRIEFVLISG